VRPARSVLVVRSCLSAADVEDVAFLPTFAHAEVVEVDLGDHLQVALVQVLGGFEDSREAAGQQQLLGVQDQRRIPLLDADVVEVDFLALARDVEVQGVPAPPAPPENCLDAWEPTFFFQSDEQREAPHGTEFMARVLELPCLRGYNLKLTRLSFPDLAL